MTAKFNLTYRQKTYLVVGVSVYVFELLVIFIAQRLGASDILAVGLSFWLGLLVSFGLQKIVTFGDKRTHYKVVGAQLVLFALLVGWNFVFTLGVTKLLNPFVPAVVCRTVALAITTVWNYTLYRTKLFKQSEEMHAV